MVPFKALSDQVCTRNVCFIAFKTTAFLSSSFATKSDLHISTVGIRRIKHFQTLKNNNIFHIIDQKMVSKVPTMHRGPLK